MRTDPIARRKAEKTTTSSVRRTRIGRMRAAVEQAVAVAPNFLRGELDADHMAKTMVHAVNRYFEEERAAGSDATPMNAEGRALQGALTELMTCGSGYLAGRCDADCVSRTMTQMLQEFPAH